MLCRLSKFQISFHSLYLTWLSCSILISKVLPVELIRVYYRKLSWLYATLLFSVSASPPSILPSYTHHSSFLFPLVTSYIFTSITYTISYDISFFIPPHSSLLSPHSLCYPVSSSLIADDNLKVIHTLSHTHTRIHIYTCTYAPLFIVNDLHNCYKMLQIYYLFL